MNKPLLFLVLIFAAKADALEIRTLTGKIYRQCEIVRIHPDGVSFTHENGAAKVIFQDMPAHLRQKLGYDPQRAANYAKELENQRAAAEETRKKRDAELTAAMALAQQMELARLRGVEELARAQIFATQSAPQKVIPEMIPLGPALHSDIRWARRPLFAPQTLWLGYPSLGNCYPIQQPLPCPQVRRGGTSLHVRW